MFPSFEGIV